MKGMSLGIEARLLLDEVCIVEPICGLGLEASESLNEVASERGGVVRRAVDWLLGERVYIWLSGTDELAHP